MNYRRVEHQDKRASKLKSVHSSVNSQTRSYKLLVQLKKLLDYQIYRVGHYS